MRAMPVGSTTLIATVEEASPEALDQIAANLRALAKGLSVAGLVDRRRGY